MRQWLIKNLPNPILGLMGLSPLSDDKHAQVLNNSPLAAFTYRIKDDEPRILFANEQAMLLFSQQESPIGRNFSTMILDEDLAVMHSFCRSALTNGNSGRSTQFFVRGHGGDGEAVQLMGITSPYPSQTEDSGICYLIDISQSEQQRQHINTSLLEGYVSTLVAGVVHDVRNILTTIIGTAEVLQFTLTDQDTLTQIERIIDSGDRGSEKVTALLQLDKNTAQNSGETNIDLQSSLQNTVDLLRIQLPKGIKLNSSISGDLYQHQIKRALLEQILFNLINNAAQAINDTGTISISITTEQANNNAALKISVTDDGCGIEEENLSLVTQSLWSTRKEQGGTGLGLTIVKRIATKQGGSLDISSTVGVGTQVDVLLPEKTAHKPKTQKTQPVQAEPTPANPKVKPAQNLETIPCSVLLVDDNTDVLESQRLLVEAMGHKTFTATSGDEGLALYKAHKQDIQMIITDFKMPIMDGIELAILLRKINHKLPIIMLTGYGESSKLKQCKELDIELLLKPCGFQKLSLAIHEIQNKNQELFS